MSNLRPFRLVVALDDSEYAEIVLEQRSIKRHVMAAWHYTSFRSRATRV